jgi:hypothetical protein
MGGDGEEISGRGRGDVEAERVMDLKKILIGNPLKYFNPNSIKKPGPPPLSSVLEKPGLMEVVKFMKDGFIPWKSEEVRLSPSR